MDHRPAPAAAGEDAQPRLLWRISLHPLLLLSAILAMAYGFASPSLYDAGAWLYAMAAFKASSILLLAAIAALARARLLTWALLFGAAGDIGLALGAHTFLAGAACFLLGHLCYIALFVRSASASEAKRPWRRVTALAICVGAILATILAVPADSDLLAPLNVYTGVLTLMTMSSFLLPGRYWLTIAGAVLFLISDGFVAANMFHRNPDPMLAYWLSFVGWMIYWVAQACLCFGARGLLKGGPASQEASV